MKNMKKEKEVTLKRRALGLAKRAAQAVLRQWMWVIIGLTSISSAAFCLLLIGSYMPHAKFRICVIDTETGRGQLLNDYVSNTFARAQQDVWNAGRAHVATWFDLQEAQRVFQPLVVAFKEESKEKVTVADLAASYDSLIVSNHGHGYKAESIVARSKVNNPFEPLPDLAATLEAFGYTNAWVFAEQWQATRLSTTARGVESWKPSRVWGDCEPEVQAVVIEVLKAIAKQHGLTDKKTSRLLATVRQESGFNPYAAAGTTSAFGLVQCVKDHEKTLSKWYGMHRKDSWYEAMPSASNPFLRQVVLACTQVLYVEDRMVTRGLSDTDENFYALHYGGVRTTQLASARKAARKVGITNWVLAAQTVL